MTSSKAQSPIEISRPTSREKRLTELGITLPAPPEPFGIYVGAVQTGNLLCLTGMFRTHRPEIEIHRACRRGTSRAHRERSGAVAALNAIAVVRKHLGSLDKVTWIVRFGVLVATSGAFVHKRRSPTPLRSCCKRFSAKTGKLPFCVRSREPPAWRSSRTWGYFRGR